VRYRYVGPWDLLAGLVPAGRPVESADSLTEASEPFTFVVDLDGVLWLAPRRTEHVACAGGRDVLAAGEISFRSDVDGWSVDEVSNQSTGYCPDPDSWPAVAAALDELHVRHPSAFTNPVAFRRCPRCAQRNIVRDGVFVCAVCDADLPSSWNF
jgi:hypothetical protein